MPASLRDYDTPRLHRTVQLLISNLVELKDASGEFLLRLEDGRVIDTKGWNDWEWTHGIGLYGIHQYYQLTGDERCLQIMEDWFRDRFRAGTPTKNVNTMAPLLTLANLYAQNGEPTYRPYLDAWAERSEEHTSELQSLMRISYAVFCLKKKKKINTHVNNLC